MLDKELERIKQNPNYVAVIETALDALEDQRVIHFLRAFGRAHRKPGASFEDQAAEGNWSAGWQDCLDTLMNFREIFITEKTSTPNLQADYGGRAHLLANEEISKEEHDYIRNPNADTRAAVFKSYRTPKS